MGNCYKLKNGCGNFSCKGCGRQDKQLNTYDWLADIPGNSNEQNMVEVQFKNTRKGYFINSNKLKIEKGDTVAVEASPGHDIGVVTLTGRLVPLQMKKANLKPDVEIKRVYRKVKPVDMGKYEEAKSKEHETMIKSRQIAKSLNLNMKIGDVEYQGDGNKAIFYYIADERVDFRQLIKVLAETFHVRIEMKQIGARQEAGRIGGIGPCGRELCCATWITSFSSVSTTAARFQDISLNPQKLAGQCAKLKCCMNYEVDAYVEAQKRFPSREIQLETLDNTFFFFKADILKGLITYSTDKSFLANAITISTKRAFDIINMNRRGEKPETLIEQTKQEPKKPIDLLEQESVTRFDNRKNKNKKKKKGQDNGNKKQDNNQVNDNLSKGNGPKNIAQSNVNNDPKPAKANSENKGVNNPNNSQQNKEQGKKQQNPNVQQQNTKDKNKNNRPNSQNDNRSNNKRDNQKPNKTNDFKNNEGKQNVRNDKSQQNNNINSQKKNVTEEK